MSNLTELINLQDYDNIKVLLQENMKKFSTMRLNSRGSLILVKNIESLKKVISFLNDRSLSYTIVGLGSNFIFPDSPDDIYIKLDFSYDLKLLKNAQDLYTLPASCPLARLTSHAQKFGNKGWEVFTGIPGSLGGAVAMNAGTKLGEIGKLVKSLKIITNQGEIKNIEIISFEDFFAYRKNKFLNDGDVIFEVTLGHNGFSDEIPRIIKNYSDHRWKTQPLGAKTCGCIFKNKSSELLAGRLIDQLGLKGTKYKGIRISPLHGNFMENEEGANYEDFKDFIYSIRNEIYLQTGVLLDLEVYLPK